MRVATAGLLCCLAAPTLALAAPCYTLLNQRSAIVYQAGDPPINLAPRIGDELARSFPGYHLVMGEAAECPVVLLATTSADRRGAVLGNTAVTVTRSRRGGRPDRS